MRLACTHLIYQDFLVSKRLLLLNYRVVESIVAQP